MKKSILKLLIINMAMLVTIEDLSAATKYVSVGTGAITGVYYPAGGAICRLLNRGRKEHGIRCSVESTGGSVSNINAIRNSVIDFGIVQSDWQYNAYNGSGFFSDQSAFKELRSVFSLYTETFTIAVLEKSGIKKLDDILGKRVNFGPQGSGMYATMEVLLNAKGWKKEDFSSITYLQPSEQPKALCDEKIDVMVYVAGNPNGVMQEATQTCKVRIIPIDSETITKLLQNNTYYAKAVIPANMYSGNGNNIETFGIKASLITSEKTSLDVVYNMTKSVFENFDNFKTLHPVFSSLKKEDMVKDGNSAPLHPGALKYFKESKLVK
jgi:TRAP transporter TAXI family solute receptor